MATATNSSSSARRRASRNTRTTPATRAARSGTAPSRIQEIREAALTLFADGGYHGTGMEDIARRNSQYLWIKIF